MESSSDAMSSVEQARMHSLHSSVYVRGFVSGLTTEEDLIKLFGQFGPVKKVYIDADKVFTCSSLQDVFHDGGCAQR